MLSMFYRHSKGVRGCFFIVGDLFEECLAFLRMVLQICIESNFIHNWEKCHFIVKEGIVLDYRILGDRLHMDQTKIEVIAKLPPHS